MVSLGEFVIENVFGDWSNVDWSEFTRINDFKWAVGKTPFSQIQFPVAMGLGYILSVYFLQAYMRDRKPFTLKAVTFIHNMFLCLLSLSMFLGAAYGAALKLQNQGFFDGWLCEQDAKNVTGPLFYWSYIFYLSKFYEYIDTYLLVLKKKPVIFLHEYHHFIMPFVCYAGLEGKWCMALWTSTFWNSFVHVFMYFYYAVSTIGYNPWWKKYLTMLQIYQFVSGVVYTTAFLWFYFQKVDWVQNSSSFTVSVTQGCIGDLRAIAFMYAVNCSFLVLFVKFYYETYSTQKKREPKVTNGGPNSEASKQKQM